MVLNPAQRYQSTAEIQQVLLNQDANLQAGEIGTKAAGFWSDLSGLEKAKILAI